MSDKEKFTFGQVVNVSSVYVRKEKIDPSGASTGWQKIWKCWEQKPFDGNGCIFLGTRTLQNGYREYDSEFGYYFDPAERFKAALISPSETRNVIYVPLSAVNNAAGDS